ncbi:ABC transporter substrate-binding protein [Sphingosinicella sp. BN140058]|uniref:ABC transporter substrate-binding protein n=1 Tax=Sphingosinicella sp. BN140058 TaxID=1892855 RepID=UPI0010139D92|nr:ABC transporter substrate-binding protein [Sphingosinicella sp. BN140058]QAY75639.1 ABC transporter substrate-binding protein [Sphingosinicella sp. BN140058]
MEPEPPSQSPVEGRKIERRWLLRGALGAGAAAAVALPARRFLSPAEAAQPLTVGGLAVTCNLTLPIACAANDAANPFGMRDAAQLAFGYSRYTGWPELKESLMSGDLQAAYMLAPLVMDLADKQVPVKIVSIGHRSGAVIMVHKDSPYQRFRDLAGKRIAIPSRFAVDFLFLRKMLSNEGMSPKDVEIVEMAPADMPAALYVKGVDAYCTGEPFGAAAQSAGYARVLRMTRDEWPRYMCCVLTVRDELIKANRPLVQNLVNYVLAAGAWLDGQRQNREKAVRIAARREYFNQDPNILRFVMNNPTDRVTYGDLRMIPREFDELMELAVAAGALSRPVAYSKYVDESFARAARPASIAL